MRTALGSAPPASFGSVTSSNCARDTIGSSPRASSIPCRLRAVREVVETDPPLLSTWRRRVVHRKRSGDTSGSDVSEVPASATGVTRVVLSHPMCWRHTGCSSRKSSCDRITSSCRLCPCEWPRRSSARVSRLRSGTVLSSGCTGGPRKRARTNVSSAMDLESTRTYRDTQA